MSEHESRNIAHKNISARRRSMRRFPIQAILIVVVAILAFFAVLIIITLLEVLVLGI